MSPHTTSPGKPPGLGSAAAGPLPIRAYCLAAPEVRASDLQRVYRMTFSRAASFLEELRLLGSAPGPGPRRWSPTLPIDEARVRMLRAVLGWSANV